jgi:hypothetical protein
MLFPANLEILSVLAVSYHVGLYFSVTKINLLSPALNERAHRYFMFEQGLVSHTHVSDFHLNRIELM